MTTTAALGEHARRPAENSATAHRVVDRERAALREVVAIVVSTREAERDIESSYEAVCDAAREEHDGVASEADERARIASAAAVDLSEQGAFAATQGCTRGIEAARAKAAAEIEAAEDRASRAREAAERTGADAKWLAATVHDTDSDQNRQHREQRERELSPLRARVDSLRAEANALLTQRRLAVPGRVSLQAQAGSPAELLAQATECLGRMRSRPGLTSWGWVIAGALAAAAGTGVASAGAFAWRLTPWSLVGAGLAGAVAGAALWRIRVRNRARLVGLHGRTLGLLDHVDQALGRVRASADAEFERRQREVSARHARDISEIEASLRRTLASLDAELQRARERWEREARESVQAFEAAKREGLERAERERVAGLRSANEERDAARRHAQARMADRLAEAARARDSAWRTIEAGWASGIDSWRRRVEECNAAVCPLPGWDRLVSGGWTPGHAAAAVVRLGSIAVDLARTPGGLPRDTRFSLEEPREFLLPVVLEVPERGSLLLEVGPDAHDVGIAALKSTVARLLASLAPGKARFLFIDPVGLGRTFAGFMHLADDEPSLIGDRAWTEPRHIEQRLGEIAEHLEGVIQKCLRNEFATIEEYNAQAGELAEPYRFVVIADYPAAFTETAARRLRSIVESGPRCGVHTLIMVDPRQGAPEALSLADLARRSLTLRAAPGGAGWAWNDPDFAPWPLTLDPAPTEEAVTGLMRIVGPVARAAKRVRTPFELIAPSAESMWRESTAHEVRTPLGRCGAVRLQEMALGAGTTQHALVAGRTGSGKSTLLHVLITCAAMRHSPDELELYLVDFKKGVEFKPYAEHALPHARVIAIESDREFGVSVLERLDAELEERGRRFRALGRSGHRRRAPGGAG